MTRATSHGGRRTQASGQGATAGSVRRALAISVLCAGCATTQTPTTEGAGGADKAPRDRACYPVEYRRLGIEARFDVVVDISLDGKGTISRFPDGLSDEWRAAAQCAVAKLAFSPARRNGQPVPGSMSLPITFSLK